MLSTHSEVYAVGSYSSQGWWSHPLSLYEMESTSAVGLYSNLTEGAMLLLTGVGGGVTHIMFSPDGYLLFVGLRKVFPR